MKRGHVTFGLVIIFAGLVLSKGIYAQKTMISFEEFDSGTSRYTVTGYKYPDAKSGGKKRSLRVQSQNQY